MAATNKAAAELSHQDFVIAVLKDIAGHSGEEASMRLKCVDRIATLAGLYVVGSDQNVG